MSVYALGLGSLKAQSALDEPFSAEIQLNSVKTSDFGSLKTQLASRSDFQLAEVDRPAHLLLLKFEPVRKPDDSVVIQVTSKQPISEPFLHFLVVVEWAGGKLIREYTTLLDPPLYAQGGGSAISSPMAVGDSTPKVTATGLAPSTAGTLSASPVIQSGTQPKLTMGTSGSAKSGATPAWIETSETQKGDTLWGIASSIAGDSNIFKVMVAMLRVNPDAFVDNNINRLKVGQILKVPTKEQIESLTFKQAADEYLVQLEGWEAYKSQLAGRSQLAKIPRQPTKATQPTKAAPRKKQVAKAEAKSKTATQRTSKAPVKPKAPIKSKASSKGQAQPPQDLLRIVQSTLDKGKKGKGGGAKAVDAQSTRNDAEAAQLKNQIRTMEETLLSSDMENKELMERVKMLEEQVKKATRLMQIQNENLAVAQQQASDREKEASIIKQREAEELIAKNQRELAKVKAEAEAKAKAEATLAASIVAANTAKSTPKPKVAPQSKAKPQKIPTQSKPRNRAKPRKVASKPKSRKRSTPPPQKAWWEEITDMLMLNWIWAALVGLGGLIVLVGGLVFMRRRRSIAEFEDSILSGSALDSHTETTGGIGAGTDTSFLSDFGVPGMGTMQADEVDPVAEAEVYLAYGRDEQAEEVLKEAIGRDGSRQELKLKLLEIYSQRNDLSAFETLAEELYPAQGEPQTDIWRKVLEMGHKLNPDNPLFSQPSATIPPVPTVPPVPPEQSDGLIGTTTGQVDPRLQPFPEPDKDHNTDLQLEQLEKEREPTEPDVFEPFPQPEEGGLPDLDLTQLDKDVGTTSLLEDQPTGLDFDIGIDEAIGGTTTLGDDDQNAAQKTMIASAPPNIAAPDPAVEEELSAGLNHFEMDGLDIGGTVANLETVDTPVAAGATAKNDTLESFTLDTDIGQLEVTSPTGVSGGAIGPGAVGGSADSTLEGLDAGSYDLSMDSDDPTASGGEADDVQWDEAATKLDLAKAYIDMGDESGARSIIDEVLKEGNEGQRKQAAQLAAQLAG